jgi:SAM-dependent methyltransferase
MSTKVNFEINLLSEEEIINIHNKYVEKSEEYYRKAHDEYQKLSDSEKQKWFNCDFPRLASFFDFKDWISKYNLKHVKKLLATCSGDCELEYISYDSITVCNYLQDKKYDLHTIDLDDKDYDMIIFNQTLEHLYNPFISMKNLYDHLKPGGYLYTTVPTINIPHQVPFHFWGMTPTGLCTLCASVGFNILECGYWGNISYINHIFTHFGWPNTSNIMIDDTIENVDHCQSQTWILVQK